MDRRTLLAACGTGLAGLAGCTAIDGTGDADDGPDDGSGGPPAHGTSPTPTGAASLSVSVRALEPAVVLLATDSIHVSGSGQQYLHLEVSVEEGQPPAREELRLRFDGATSRPMETRGLWYAYNHRNEQYTAERGAGWLLYELPPTGDASDAALRWPGGEWRPDAGIRERLAAAAPPLSMEATVPETVPPNSQPTIEFTVTNEGSTDGRFVAALNRTGPSVAYTPVKAISHLVPAGGTRTFSVTDPYGIEGPPPEARGDGEPDLTYRLNWPGGELDRAVRVVEA